MDTSRAPTAERIGVDRYVQSRGFSPNSNLNRKRLL